MNMMKLKEKLKQQNNKYQQYNKPVQPEINKQRIG